MDRCLPSLVSSPLSPARPLFFLRLVELFEHQGVLLEVGALADDQALDGQVAQGLEPFVVAEIRIFEVEVLDLALVPVVDAGDVDVDVAQGPRPELPGVPFRSL